MIRHYAAAANLALDNDALRAAAPSIFAREAHESRSERFAPIATIDVVEGMRKAGFEPFKALQCQTRDESRKDFTKHIIRFRSRATKQYIAGVTPEVVLVNANDGSSAYKLMGGMFRFICSNGMIIQNCRIDETKVRHSGNAVDDVIEGSFRVISTVEEQQDRVIEWSGLQLPAPARLAFAESARMIRLGDAEGEVDSPIKAEAFLVPRRSEDRGTDLWTVFNVIQENSIRGGLSAREEPTKDERGIVRRGRMRTTREIGGIDQDVKVNRALWSLGEKMASILSSQARAA